jgi:hypothetical protein
MDNNSKDFNKRNKGNRRNKRELLSISNIPKVPLLFNENFENCEIFAKSLNFLPAGDNGLVNKQVNDLIWPQICVQLSIMNPNFHRQYSADDFINYINTVTSALSTLITIKSVISINHEFNLGLTLLKENISSEVHNKFSRNVNLIEGFVLPNNIQSIVKVLFGIGKFSGTSNRFTFIYPILSKSDDLTFFSNDLAIKLDIDLNNIRSCIPLNTYLSNLDLFNSIYVNIPDLSELQHINLFCNNDPVEILDYSTSGISIIDWMYLTSKDNFSETSKIYSNFTNRQIEIKDLGCKPYDSHLNEQVVCDSFLGYCFGSNHITK